jgi:hypothetical protein
MYLEFLLSILMLSLGGIGILSVILFLSGKKKPNA